MHQIRRIFDRAARARWMPWIAAGAILAGFLGYEILNKNWFTSLPLAAQVAFWTLALVTVLVSYLTFSRFSGLVEGQRALEARLAGEQRRTAEAYHRLEAILRVSQEFIKADDENQIVEPVMRLLVDLAGAEGAAFVPIDEHGQPQTVLSYGQTPSAIGDAWLEYLSSSPVRQRCGSCEQREPVERPIDCPLLTGLFANAGGLICFSIRRGEREFGVMNLFLPEHGPLDPSLRIFIQTVLDETALGLEGLYLRRRELIALRQMQVLRQKSDLAGQLKGLLEGIYRTLEADFAQVTVLRSGSFQGPIDLELGDVPESARPFLAGLIQGVLLSAEPALLGDLAGDPAEEPAPRLALKSLVAAPLLSPERRVIGAVLVGNRRARGYQPRQLALLQTFAGQAVLMVQNAGLMAELEYRTMIQERARLAREIHDGLAQTIGYLKLQAGQLRSFIQRGDLDRARQTIDPFYSTLAETYQDARQAIDGLRVSPDKEGLPGWLEGLADEFGELSGLQVTVACADVPVPVPPEIQAQLIRIVQEALSNVRKHSCASQVWIDCATVDSDLVMEVRDDGQGFAPEDVTTVSRYGLRGMRERAELIGADFQVESRPQQGAVIRVRLPLPRPENSKLIP